MTESEKRHDERHPITLRVDYKRMNTFFADYAKNISKGGTFIRTGKPLDIGTRFNFVLSIPSRSEQLQLNGEVMWVVTEDEATGSKVAGMGIGFVFDEDSERQEVHDFVESLMAETLGEHVATKLLAKEPR
jgi:type IV pilus assembly protein PilZ